MLLGRTGILAGQYNYITVKILENLAWGSRYADLTEVQPTIGVPSLLTTWPPKGGREGKNLHSLTASEQLHKKSELKPFTQCFIPGHCSMPEPIARLVACMY